MMYFGAHSTLIMAFEKTLDFTRTGGERKGVDILKWDPNDKGYSYRAASVVMEWIIVAIFCTFIVTFTAEFKTFRVEEPQCKFLFIKVEELGEREGDEESRIGAAGDGYGEMGGDVESEGKSNSVYTDDLNDDDDDENADAEIVTPIHSSEIVVAVDKLERVVVV
ncbi:unnamed protein product [Orchesella dallaii]|uniref:Uncharacterized protein n=1 Tax=Orchesella dallaii TaxID=48710 RepID=A0ABP1RYY3_9HEXA